ncbi:MAG: hypothetical protein ACFFER_13120 [Candidatus Thorarchaeota archaeon]
MNRLTAIFTIELDSYLLVQFPTNDELSHDKELVYQFSEGLFDIELKMKQGGDWRTKHKDEINWIFPIASIVVAISREEENEVPALIVTPDGKKSYELRSPFFNELVGEYQEMARNVVNRAIYFFKYELHQPLLNFRQDFRNPTWFNENGERLYQHHVFIVDAIPGLTTGKLKATIFTPNEELRFSEYLASTQKPKLHEELLSDAQAAFFEDNLRRTILEMAIACEVFVKQFFFSQGSITTAIFDFLEDKKKLDIQIIELIDKGAKYCLGHSFREEFMFDYEKIDYMFRCRNKIAHRGESIYRDYKGNIITADRDIIDEWWISVWTLIDWLEKLWPN